MFKTHTSCVSSCNPAKLEIDVEGKKKVIDCFEAVFGDTVFFPEGGGQPCDYGHINDIQVLKVIRKGSEAIHFLEAPVNVNESASQSINWDRRYDHMQQHSAQHLITALADNKYGWATLSWNLGDKISSIELQTTEIGDEQLKQLEEDANEQIRKAVPVVVQEFEANDPQLQKIRTRGLPDDVSGPIRVVTMEDIDSNMCCGTHVRNLSDLQAIKLLSAEKAKGGKMNLNFLAGNRVLTYLGDCFSRERQLCTILNTNPNEAVRLVEKSKKEAKQNLKLLKEAQKDLAVAEAKLFKSLNPTPQLFLHHRRDADLVYLGVLAAEIEDESVLKVLTAGEGPDPGCLLISGPKDKVDSVSTRLCEILEGKGGGKTRFTAKTSKPSRWKEAQKYVSDLFAGS